MGDLSELNASLPVKVVTADSTGLEQAYVSSQANGSARALDVGINVSGVQIDPRQISSFPSDGAPATQNVTTQDLASATATGANGQVVILGTPTAGSVASFVLSSVDTIEVQVSGVWTGTLESEVSMDGGTFWYTRGVKQTGSPYIASTFTGGFAGGLSVAAMTNFRIRATTAVTGTAIVRIATSLNTSNITVTNPVMLRDATTQTLFSTIKAASTAAVATDPAIVVAVSPNNTPVLPNGAATASNQTGGTQKTQVVDGSGNVMPAGDTVGRAQFQKVTDGTNTAAVKAASTAAVATDPALVVAISPNNGIAISGTISTKTDLTPSSPTTATVGITSAQALAANANRKGLIIVNVSVNKVSLGIGSTAVLNSGITLYPGGSFEMGEYCFDVGAINAIASVASSVISIQEFTT